MADFILSANTGVGEFWPIVSGPETVARFQLTPRATFRVRSGCEAPECIVAAGSQISAFIHNDEIDIVDARLYVGSGNRDFELSLTAGYTASFGDQFDPNNGFGFGIGVEFNPVFFITRQPIWLMIGYDCRLFADADELYNTHMVWAGLSLMLDWLWNPGRYA